MTKIVKYIFIPLLFWHCATFSALKGGQDREKIMGFTQFDFAGNRDYIGYIYGSDNQFLHKVWEGAPYNVSKVNQVINVDITEDKSFAFGLEFDGLLGGKDVDLEGKSKSTNYKKIVLKLVNPQVISIQNPYPSPMVKNRPDLLKEKYVSEILKVDRIEMMVIDNNGVEVSGESEIPNLKTTLNTDIKYDSKSKSTSFAENAYVGYKLSDPPPNADKIESYSGDVTALYKDQNRIAVLPFEVKSSNPDDKMLYEDGIPEILELALNKVESMNIIPTESVRALMQEPGSSNLSPVIIGQRLNVTSVFKGQLLKVGESYRIICKIYDIKKGVLDKSYSISPEKTEYDVVMQAISFETLKNFGIQATKTEDKAIKQITESTKNSKAFSLYIEGKKKYSKYDYYSLLEAEKIFQNAIKEDSSYTLAYVGLANTYLKIFEYYKAYGIYDVKSLNSFENYCNKAYGENSELPETLLCKSRIFSNLKYDKTTAINYAYNALLKDSGSAETYMELFWLYEESYQVSGNQYFQRAIELGKTDIEVNISAAIVYLKEGNLNKAKDYTRKAISLNRNRFLTLTYLTRWYSYYGKGKAFLTYLNTAEKNFGKHGIIEYNRGYIYHSAGEYNKAIDSYKKSLSLAPQFTECMINLAIAYSANKDYNNSKSTYEELLKINPNNSYYFRSYGKMELELGKDSKSAKELFNKSCELGDNVSCQEAKKI